MVLTPGFKPGGLTSAIFAAGLFKIVSEAGRFVMAMEG